MNKRKIKALTKEYRREKDAVRRGHIQTIKLVLEGMARDEVARVTGFSVRWIRKLMRRWRDEGLAGLGNKRLNNKGKEPLLDEAGIKALAKLLEGAPPDQGLWSGRKIAAWMSKRLGREVGPKLGLQYLHRLGFTRQRPRPQHAKSATPEKREAFKKNCKIWCGPSAGNIRGVPSKSGRLMSTDLV
jgi:transposase